MLATVTTAAPFERPTLRALPRIVIAERRFVCNGRMLDLARRPLTMRVFEAFLASRDGTLKREDVVELVYPRWREAPRTERYEASCIGNTVKLLSRCRQLAQQELSDGPCAGLRWLPYDTETKTWSLYRLTPEYLEG